MSQSQSQFPRYSCLEKKKVFSLHFGAQRQIWHHSLLKFKFNHKFILGDRCSPWRHRRGRRLLNLSFILFLLPCIKPHQPGCYQDLIKTNFNKKGTESINSIPPPRLSLWHIGWKGHHLWPSVCLVPPLSCWDIALALGRNGQISSSGRKHRFHFIFVFWKSLIHKYFRAGTLSFPFYYSYLDSAQKTLLARLCFRDSLKN